MSIVANDDAIGASGERYCIRGPSAGKGSSVGLARRILEQRTVGERRPQRISQMFSAHDPSRPGCELNVPGRRPVVTHQVIATRYTVTGWLLFLRSIGGHCVSVGDE